MSIRAKFFIILGVVIAFILFVIVLLSRSGGEKVPVEVPSVRSQGIPETGATPPSAPSPESPPAVTPRVETRGTTDALALARSFAERFGSFSNQSNFENIRELTSLMTPLMRLTSDRLVADARAKTTPNAPYYGITTRALASRVTAMDDGTGVADIVVSTQRREVKDRATPRVFYQDLALTLKRVEGEWRVERAEWK